MKQFSNETMETLNKKKSKIILISSLFVLAILSFLIFSKFTKGNLGVNKFFASVNQSAQNFNENVQEGKLFNYDEAGVKAPIKNQDYLAKAKKQTETADNSSAGSQTQQVANYTNLNLAGIDNPTWGQNNAPVKIVIFSDFFCPFCAKFALETIPQIKKNYAGQAQIIFRDLPVDSSHPGSSQVHIAASCANSQGKFWEMHDLIFANQNKLNSASLITFAEKIGLNLTTFNSCLSSDAAKIKVVANLEAGINLGLRATPTIFVNGVKLEGAVSYSQIKNVIDQN